MQPSLVVGRSTSGLRCSRTRSCQARNILPASRKTLSTPPKSMSTSSEPSNASMEAAVRENRMISREEANGRKIIGGILTAIAVYNISTQGLDAMSPGYFAFSLACPLAMLGTGVLNLCGCSLRLQWSVGEGFNVAATRCPASYEEFMKGKRRQFLSLLFGTAAATGLVAFVLYTLTGRSSGVLPSVQSIGGWEAVYLAIFFSLSWFGNREAASKSKA